MPQALAIPTASVPAPRGAIWIPIKEASERMGVSERRVDQLANEKWYASGQARRMATDGRRLCLHVRSDADPLLARVISPDDLTIDLRDLPRKQRDELLRREDIYARWLAALADAVKSKSGRTDNQVTADFILRLDLDDGTRISRTTLYRWHRDFRQHGRRGLLDGRWREQAEKPSAAGAFLDEVKRLYLDKKCRSRKLCYDRACDKADEEGWEKTSYKSACRFLGRIPASALSLHRGGVEEFKNTSASYIERDYSTIDSNSVWVSDHHQFDVIVNHEKCHVRPWLTAWLDARSRMIVGWRIMAHSGNQDTILGSFRDGCLTFGVPQEVYIDNGADYDAHALQGQTKLQRQRRRRKGRPVIDGGIFGELGIEVTHALPFNPQAKTIERFFRTAADRFAKMWPTYCGRSPDQKPDDLSDRLKRNAAPELADFIAAFGDWLEADYHDKIHTGDSMDGRTPREVFDACLVKKRVLAADLAALLLLKRTRPIKVARNGVRYHGLIYGIRELSRQLGKYVTLRIDESDLASVQVYSHPEDKFITSARCNEKLPFKTSEQALREAMAEKRREHKATRDYHQMRPRMADSLAVTLYRKRMRMQAEAAANPTASPGNDAALIAIRSPLESELPAVAADKKATAMRIEPDAPRILDDIALYRSKWMDVEDEEEGSSFDFMLGYGAKKRAEASA